MRCILASALFLAAPALAQETRAPGFPDDAAAVAVFSAVFGQACMGAFLEDGSLIEPPQRYEVASPLSWSDAPTPMVIWDFRCEIYAYNVSRAFLSWSGEKGILPVALPEPVLKMYGMDPEEAMDAPDALDITGWTAAHLPINAGFDPGTLEIREHVYWRGLGDASSTGIWRLQDERFQLIRYDVDASYDNEINPVTLVNYE